MPSLIGRHPLLCVEKCHYPRREPGTRSVAYTRMKLYGTRAATSLFGSFGSTRKVLLHRLVM